MKRSIILFLAVLLLLPLAACKSDNNHTYELPKAANDPEVLARWDEYPMLDGVPRYKLSGILEDFYKGPDGSVVVSFLGVSDADFESYCTEVLASGYRLKDGSSIWYTTGMSGVPQFEKGSRSLTLVWSMNGSLDISSEP
ncbi:MAG: hypothetical protein J6P98_07275 [Clostridia bacterium]|nr:hypothetical protein [Clostridia bacterium]